MKRPNFRKTVFGLVKYFHIKEPNLSNFAKKSKISNPALSESVEESEIRVPETGKG